MDFLKLRLVIRQTKKNSTINPVRIIGIEKSLLSRKSEAQIKSAKTGVIGLLILLNYFFRNSLIRFKSCGISFEVWKSEPLAKYLANPLKVSIARAP